MARITLSDARARVAAALQQAGANPAMAESTARALVLAESQGLGSHGIGRVAQYCTHLRNGRVHGDAVPTVAGVIVDHLRPLAAAGFVGLGFANSPAAMPAAGGRHPIFGTNPIAAIFPRRAAAPLLIDLSLSEVARGKLMVAAKEGREIPAGWALDASGAPTTDPKAGLEGSMLPVGAVSSPKGAMLALVVELLVTALIGAHFGFEASSFFVDEGNRPRIGQTFIVIDPGALAGREAFFDRLEVLLREMLVDEGVRLPGERREALRQRAEAEGLEVGDAVLRSLPAA